MYNFASNINNMLYINRHSTNPYVNLATEEYILKNIDDDCFMLWINEPCIIVGKHQNTLAEINYDYVTKNNIPVVRRLSGGGTVFHDLGNINFTFIKKENNNVNINFKQFTQPILDILNDLGVEAVHGGKNDLLINGKKISGNAEHIWKHKVMHHGTLLFSSNINNLSSALKVKTGVYTDKAVQSNRSEVTNISEHLRTPLTITQFTQLIIERLRSYYKDISFYDLTDEDHLKIDELVATKYNTWAWNFGYSPFYKFNKSFLDAAGNPINISLAVKDGIITAFEIKADFMDASLALQIETALLNKPHNIQAIKKALDDVLIVTTTEMVFISSLLKNIL